MQSFSELEQEAWENFLPWQYSLKCWLRLHWSWQTRNQILISLKMFHFLITLRKWPLSKSLQQQRGLIRVLFSRHTLERDWVPCWRLVSASVYFLFWCRSEVTSEENAETGGQVSYSLCPHSEPAQPIPGWQIWHSVGGCPTSNAQLLWLPGHGLSPPLQNPPDDESLAL